MAGGERSDLRLLLLRRVEDVPSPARVAMDRARPHSGDCLSRIFSPAGLGTDLWSRASVFHAGISRAARRPAMACGIGHWITDIQTTVGYSRGHRVSIRGRVAGHRWWPGRRRTPACRSLDALWFRGHASLLACTHQYERSLAAARATALPDTLTALFLVAAVAVACKQRLACTWPAPSAFWRLQFGAGEVEHLWRFAIRRYCSPPFSCPHT